VTLPTTPKAGDFVCVRTRRWLVEAERSAGEGLAALRLACVDDDAQGEVVEVLWDAELEIIRARAANFPPREAGYVRLTFVGLQQRLLSSIAAFAKTLEVHRNGLLRADVAGSAAAAEAFVHGGAETEDEPIDEIGGEKLIQEEEDQAAEAAGVIAAGVSDLALVNEMLEIARKHGHRPDARIGRLVEWVRANMAPDGRWNERRLVLFTEYEDTRRWVEKRLADTPRM
jgi:hypothetical protein